MIQRHYKSITLLSVAILMFACAMPSFAPAASAPVPTFDPNSISTVIALTANSAATQTAQMLPPTLTPTVTLIPAGIPTQTETPTATFLFSVPTITPVPTQGPINSSGEKFDCRVTSQTPEDNSVIAKGLPFEMRWRVVNIGTDVWDSNSADYRYVSGDQIHLSPSAFDLNQSVAPGETAELVVKMQAPTDPGTYSTRWKLNIGKIQFCTMKITITVNP
jgi:hypothetical protein